MAGTEGAMAPTAAPMAIGTKPSCYAITFVTVGAILWLVHGVLMLVGLVSIVSIPLGAVGGDPTAAFAAAGALLAATAVVFLASVFLATAIIPSAKAQGRAAPGAGNPVLAGVLFLFFAAMAGVALAAGIVASGVVVTLDLATLLVMGQVVFAAWAGSAVVLALTGILAPRACTTLGLIRVDGRPLLGKPFLAFAIVSAVGVLMLVVPLLLTFGGAGIDAFAIVAIVGLVLTLLVVPVLEIVVFLLILLAGLQARKAVRPS